jgi:MFS transporter, DHA2 family, multidrug resistance protein
MEIRPLIGLFGVIVAALTSEFNDQVTNLALPDIRGGLGVSMDQGTWLSSLISPGRCSAWRSRRGSA